MICFKEPTPSLFALAVNDLFAENTKRPRSLRSQSTSSASSVTSAWNKVLKCTSSAMVLRFRKVSVFSIDVSISCNSFSMSDRCSTRRSMDCWALSSTSLNISCFFASMTLIKLSTKFCALFFTQATCSWISLHSLSSLVIIFLFRSTFSFWDSNTDSKRNFRSLAASCKATLTWPSWSVTTQVLQMATLQSLQKNFSFLFSWCSFWQNTGLLNTFSMSSSWKSLIASTLWSLLARMMLWATMQSSHQKAQHLKQ